MSVCSSLQGVSGLCPQISLLVPASQQSSHPTILRPAALPSTLFFLPRVHGATSYHPGTLIIFLTNLTTPSTVRFLITDAFMRDFRVIAGTGT